MSFGISIIVPVYNEEQSLTEFYASLSTVIDSEAETSEVIFINDGSEDQTESMLRQLRQHDRRVKLIHFSRNFGHQMAITAGINLAQGQVCIVIDGDLQDPPDVIPDMLKLWRSGFDLSTGFEKNDMVKIPSR